MAITRIEVSNFKSFKKLELDLRDFNLLIGANASGKSNFIQIFKFLRDIAKEGLEDAISMQGRVEFLPNLNIGTAEPLRVRVISAFEEQRAITFDGNKHNDVRWNGFDYVFSLTFNKNGAGFNIFEQIVLNINLYRYELKAKYESDEKTGLQSQNYMARSQKKGNF